MALAIEWGKIQEQHDKLALILADPSIDAGKRRNVQKELSRLSVILERYRETESIHKQIDEALAQASASTDAEMAQLFREEAETLNKTLVHQELALEELLFPADPLDDRSVYLEIRAGTGGQEAALFAGDLQRMYANYAEHKGWKVSVEEASPTDLGGFKDIVLFIKGHGVYGLLKRESGVHRVQRVPATETAGRIHTSTATVAVLPEAEDIDVTINPADLRIDTFRSGGAGGQHVNKTESAIRITHIPTGIVVSCQEDRSQHKNKAKALKMLQSRILVSQRERQEQERSKQRKEQVGTGERAEKVRTYNFPQNRVTDHQVDLTLKHLDTVMEGHLDEIVDALRAKEMADRRKGELFVAI